MQHFVQHVYLVVGYRLRRRGTPAHPPIAPLEPVFGQPGFGQYEGVGTFGVGLLALENSPRLSIRFVSSCNVVECRVAHDGHRVAQDESPRRPWWSRTLHRDWAYDDGLVALQGDCSADPT